MCARNVIAPQRLLAVFLSTAFVVALLAARATAQNASQPRDEIFGGYSYLNVHGTADFGVKLPDIAKGFDASNTFYFTRTGAARNLGFVADGSGHFDRDHDYVGIGFALFGLQYKYHTDGIVSPFARFLMGVANLSPALPPTPPNYPNQWKFAVGGGGGIDLNITRRLAVRAVQLDYLHNSYDASFPTSTQNWNHLRLASGLVVSLGPSNKIAPEAACVAQPAEVMEGEPVKVTATGTNFNPKHTLTYSWTTNGGKLSGNDAQTATIDTTGTAAGSYTANATISDRKMRKNGSATCAANFTVKAKPMNPPQASCSANPATVQAGTPSTITASASSPDNSPITGYSYQASAGTISGSGTTATLDTTGLKSGPVNVTVTATDARNLSGTGTCTVNVEAPPPPPQVTARTPIQFIKRPKQRYIPWRVDNEAKAILDDDANALKNDPNAKLVIVGYADGEKGPQEGKGKKRHAMDLAAQRAVNAKAYLVQEQGIDPGRIEVRKGTGKDHVADIFWVPQGADINTAPLLQGTTAVDETTVKPSQNAYPKPRKAVPARHHRKGAAAGAAQSTGTAAEQGTGSAAGAVGKAAKATGHAVKKGAKKTKQAVMPK
jgi:OmpA family